MYKHFFIDEKGNIIKGKEAIERLKQQKSDKIFLSDKGIIEIPKERWTSAQTYERHTWMEAAAHATEDRNREHYHYFDGYRTLLGMRFAHAIELGCGPFTNLRYLMKVCKISRSDLLDPLAAEYLTHRNCTYTRKYLRGEEKPLNEILSRPLWFRVIRRMIRKVAPNLLFYTVPVNQILTQPIEEMPTSALYNLVVLINVIEHCYNINLIFDNIKKILNRDAVFVFHDKYYYNNELPSYIDKAFDTGHPLRVDRHMLDKFLTENFTCLYRKETRKEEIVEGIDFSHDMVYFIGRYRH